MNIEIIKNKIEKRNDVLEDELLKIKEEIDFLDSFFQNNHFNNLKNIVEVNLSDFILAYLLATTEKIELKELQRKVNFFRKFIDEVDQYDYVYIINKISKAINNILDNNLEAEEKEAVIQKTKKNISMVKDKVYLEKLTEEGFDNLIQLCDTYPNIMSNACGIVNDIMNIKRGVQDYSQMINMAESLFCESVSNKEKNKIIYKKIKDKLDLKRLDKEVSIITNYHYGQQTRQKNIQKEINNHYKFIENLKGALEKNVIDNHEELIKSLKEEEIIKDTLLLIYNHNLEPFHKVEIEHEKLSKNSILKYQSLLNRYELYKDDYDILKIMNNSLIEVEEMIKILNDFSIDKEKMISILENSNLDTIKLISNYKNKGILTINFIKDNYEILIKDSNNYKKLNDNILLVKDLNPVNFLDTNNLFLEDSKLLEKNINILKDYEYIDSIKGIQYYQFLSKNHLEDLIDKFLEVGLEEQMEANIAILNEKNINRLILLKELDLLEENNIEPILDILHKSSFIIPEENIKSYLIDNRWQTDYKDINYELDIPELNDYNYTKRTYKIGNMILSKNRVKRNYQKLDQLEKEEKIKESLIRNSIYAKEEIIDKFTHKEKEKVIVL